MLRRIGVRYAVPVLAWILRVETSVNIGRWSNTRAGINKQ
jgi:hypothetical protein